jgi:hypothetical protein
MQAVLAVVFLIVMVLPLLLLLWLLIGAARARATLEPTKSGQND